MLLAIDIGNSNIKFGVFDGETLRSKFSIPTRSETNHAELAAPIGTNLDLPISDAIVCSVVPEVRDPLTEYLRSALAIEPVFVTNDMDFGLKVCYEPLSAAGTDRLINAFAAAGKYGVPCIVCSLGTALTIDAVSADHVLRGGLIAPGMVIMAKALHNNTARLPEVPIEMPPTAIQNTTIGSIQSGIVYGYIGMVRELIARVKDESGDDPRVIATGGSASFAAEHVDLIDVVDEDLLLIGLRKLFGRLVTAGLWPDKTRQGV